MTTLDQNLVSIIVRTHSPNKLPLLAQTLHSLFENSYRPIEIVVVAQTLDNAFLAQVKQLASQFCRDGCDTVVIVNPTAKDERAKNLNLGIARASGHYLGFLDEDDIYHPNAISSLLKPLQISEHTAWAYGDVALVSCSITTEHCVIKHSIDYPFKASWFSLQEFFRGNFIPINSYLLDRDKICPDLLTFDESYNLAEDYVFLLKLATHHLPIYVEEVVSEYRVFRDLSNSTFIMNDKVGAPDKDKIKAWSYALWRIEVLKETLMSTYRPGLLSMKNRKYLYYRFPALKALIQNLRFWLRSNRHHS